MRTKLELNLKQIVGIVSIAILSITIATLLCYWVASFQGNQESLPWYAGAPYEYSYIIDENSTHYFAYNGKTGHLDYCGTKATEIIQSALDSLTNGRTWKEKVLLKGTFTIESTIKIPSYTILEIQGEIKLADNANVNVIENSEPTDGNTEIEIVGGKIDGNKDNQDGTTHGIYFKEVTFCIIRNVFVTKAKTDGIYLHTPTHPRTYWNKILECIVTYCGRNGIHTGGCRGNEIIANHCINNGDCGIDVNSMYNVVADNHCVGNRYGIRGTITQMSEIVNNFVYQNKRHGIYLISFNWSDISHNIVYDNSVASPGGYDGIYVRGDCSHNRIIGNSCTIWVLKGGGYKYQRYGINLAPGVDYSIVCFNNCRLNKVGGINYTANNNIVEDNLT